MFRMTVDNTEYIELFRNIYKMEKDCILGVAELEYEILFFTLQLPLSSLLSEGFIIIRAIRKHEMVFKTVGYLG